MLGNNAGPNDCMLVKKPLANQTSRGFGRNRCCAVTHTHMRVRTKSIKQQIKRNFAAQSRNYAHTCAPRENIPCSTSSCGGTKPPAKHDAAD